MSSVYNDYTFYVPKDNHTYTIRSIGPVGAIEEASTANAERVFRLERAPSR